MQNEDWNKMAEENAKHLAEMYIHAEHTEKIAEVLSDIHPLIALEFLYEKAHHYRHLPKPNHTKVAVILLASKMIERNHTKKLSAPSKNHKKEFKRTHKMSPKEIFEMSLV